jgi:hypothetical protein
MAKVFATLVQNGKVVLKTWSSKKAFQSEESWLDEKFIFSCTSDDMKGGGNLCNPMYTYPHENGPFMIVYTPLQLEAHQLMCDARTAHFGD